MLTKYCRPKPLTNCHYGESDRVVQSGLAMRPKDMLELSERGIPITTRNLGVEYEEGMSKLDFDPPMEHRRGIDIADMWEHRQDMRRKINSPEFQQLLNKEGGN